MTGTFVYLHGTGIPDVDGDRADIRAQLEASGRFEGWTVEVPAWAEQFGTWGPIDPALPASARAGAAALPRTDAGFDDAVGSIARDLAEELAGSGAQDPTFLGEDLVLRAVTGAIQRNRASITRVTADFARNVLLAFERREQVRGFVVDALAEIAARACGPLVVAGHSLGGVIAVDAMTAAPLERTLVVTAGSQLPLFTLLGLATPFAYPGGIRPFAPWLNVYNPRDPLAFVASTVWPPDASGSPEDLELVTPRDLPRAHSGYFSSATLYDAIADRVDRLR